MAGLWLTALGVWPTVKPARSQAISRPAFEVAVVKLSDSSAYGMSGRAFVMTGGPGTTDPERISWRNVPLRLVVLIAFGLKQPYELSAPPALIDRRYEILAKVPKGATKEQFNLMLQQLLVERFNFEAHREIRRIPGYALEVARGGPKFHESQPRPDNPETVTGTGTRGPRAFRNSDGTLMIPLSFSNSPISAFVRALENRLRSPVLDKTGLTGRYDISLDYPSGSSIRGLDSAQAVGNDTFAPELAPSLFAAVREQLGLNLVKVTVPFDILVVDHVDATPAAN